MNYAWEAVLQAEKNNIDRDNLHFIEAYNPSPYMEVSAIDLNQEGPEDDRIEINPIYRLQDVFGTLFDKNIKGMEQTRELLFDVCMHYIIQLDLREGLSREDYYCRLAEADIRNGRYGTSAKESFLLFDETEQKTILRSYLQLLKTGNYREEFRKVLIRLYPKAYIYENNEAAYELLVYLGAYETEEERKRAVFLREMFLPIQETVHWFYEHHFGIIGVDETMMMDEMVIF
ncbi:MAG: hypothetical protein HDR71_04165 [Lachnospiraceae bacterium]|nr:hypothetical protein [Lachnospiraceae bacterium]